MTGRRELIDRLMKEFFGHAEDPGPLYERPGIIVAGVEITNVEAIKKYTRMNLERRIPAVESLKTCEDFRHLNVKCSDCACHSRYEIYDMNVVPLPEGGYAWVCCAIDHAIRPEWHTQRDLLSAQTERGRLLRRTFPQLYDEKGNRRPYPFEKIHEELPFGWETSESRKPPR